jgi:hypothetical protein
MGKEEGYAGFQWGNLTEGDYVKKPGVNGRKILGWIFRNLNVRYGLDRSASGEGQVAGTCECGNERE